MFEKTQNYELVKIGFVRLINARYDQKQLN